MPTLTIDNQKVTVPDGSNVLEAAKRIGIVIPHFCYHEALGAVGACRLCAMKFSEGPVKGIQMSCMVPAQDGMVVSTVDQDAQELRAHVIEWLMMNHPHDCPVCDEGGECQLQDMTIAGGHGIRRYRGPKRTWINQELGPFVEQEMNRCIQCYRCVRTYQDYCGGTDFGVMGSRNRLFFGRFRDGRLESPFAGNIIDACPTGVFTSKPFRFKTRYWDLEEAPSICPHCSLGCAVVPGGRYREAQRVRGGINRKTNGFFICDRGRFAIDHLNHPDRPREPRWKGERTSWDDILERSRICLQQVATQYGPESIAFLGSPRASLEANWLLSRLAGSIGSSRLVYDCQARRDRTARSLAAQLGQRARSLEDIRQSDCLVLLGSDPLGEAPVLALALRQAARKGALVAVIDPRPVKLPCDAVHLPLHPGRLSQVMEFLGSGMPAASFSRQQLTILEGIRERLQRAAKPILIGGADLLGPAGVTQLFQTATSLPTNEQECGIFVPLAGPNSFSGALLAKDNDDFNSLLDDVLAGKVKALVCLENDPVTDHPERIATALGALEFLLVMDHIPNRAAKQADAFLPTTGWAEAAGSYVNNEGRMLAVAAAFEPGLPIRETGGGNYPPRQFESVTPGSLPQAAWQLLAELQELDLNLHTIHVELEAADPRFTGLSLLAPEHEGVRVRGSGQLPPATEAGFKSSGDTADLTLLVVDGLYGSERLSSFSATLQAVTEAPQLLVHPDLACRLQLSDGETVTLRTELDNVRLTLKVDPHMVDGLAITTRLYGTPLEQFASGSQVPCRIDKGGET
ncbi:MAG TPA: NADH-quinone oxidoreductase subunit NuoG [Geothermobacteraceae bacterium]|nr:NADH-quinone oxidoreductase subunit NuoG [Geothermobacteraceae bacterium]